MGYHTITSRHSRGYTESTSGASLLSISWVKAPKQARSYHLELSSLLFKRVCETLADKSMRIPTYRYQQGIQGPKIPLGGGLLSVSVSLSFNLPSRTFRSLIVGFGSELRWLKD